jgi:hypothetical protein
MTVGFRLPQCNLVAPTFEFSCVRAAVSQVDGFVGDRGGGHPGAVPFRFSWTPEQKENLLSGVTARSGAVIGDENASCAPASLEQGAAPMQRRRRFKQIDPLNRCLAEEATRLRDEAKCTPSGIERERLLRQARQVETVSHISEWLNSPGLKAPT